MFEEILASDLAGRGFLPFVYNVANINALDPSAVWLQLMADPWFSMAVFRDLEEKDELRYGAFRCGRVLQEQERRHSTGIRPAE